MHIKKYGIYAPKLTTADVLKGTELFMGMIREVYQYSYSNNIVGVDSEGYVEDCFGSGLPIDKIPFWDMSKKIQDAHKYIYLFIWNGFLKQSIIDDSFYISIQQKAYIAYEEGDKELEQIYYDIRNAVPNIPDMDIKILTSFFCVILQYYQKGVSDIIYFINEKDEAKKRAISDGFDSIQKFMLGV